MNAAAKTLFTALIAVAGAAAIGTGMADHLSVADAPAVHKLERVVVVGKRLPDAQSQIVQLPRVVIEGRSLASFQVARLDDCKVGVC
ncbi:hypothetical protein J7U46_16875 [Pelomonas sp. V22]|uniref:hypothetical protein n=1 Tax=Pelomonas sp. V22 TaxID=2822139 RepID=UPI0024A9F6F2|nr:hypothetical protein [Pelomonas sp. V22]MDI4634737.1 hypothetical protein [Pelomonas sp. V22]